MKKYIPLFVLPLVLILGGCSTNYVELAKENMSEITNAYFYGKCDEFEISLSSGRREEPYIYDGKNGDICDFALVTMDLNSEKDKEIVVFSINSNAFSCVLEYNAITGTFMADLEREISEDDNISVKFENSQINLICQSKDFQVDGNKAIEIGVNEFFEDFENMIEKQELKAECYLKILDNLSNGFEKSFWCFTIVDTKGNHFNVIIDTNSGNILAKT